ncbi:MAG: twin-arginine translocase TatA/TatE family subunit [Spirochaetaceae bacterium]|nr:MAG: twin-arginine translocase TatA/TatE family subunit [Spirochaetaceae bacterium]
MFGRIGPMELVLIFAIALIIFGPKKLPEIGKAIGSAIRNFKQQSNALVQDLDSDPATVTAKPKPAQTASDAEREPAKPGASTAE